MEIELKINGERIRLDVLDNGDLRPNVASYSEQCDGCGQDICETGKWDQRNRLVVCSCGRKHFPLPQRDIVTWNE